MREWQLLKNVILESALNHHNLHYLSIYLLELIRTIYMKKTPDCSCH